MNGATSKSFMRNLSGIGNPSHKAKRRFFEAADWNKAVGMQKGKSLFTSTHNMSPEPSVEIAAVAKSNGTQMKDLPLNSIERHDEYNRRNWKHDETTELSTKDKVVKGTRDFIKGAADTFKEIAPSVITGGTTGAARALINKALARKEGGEAVDPGKEDPAKEQKEEDKNSIKGNLNYTPEKATIVAMKRGCYKK
ncbi:MAG: hypothetical protein KAJ19_18685 [Gammaproteobacteria bacterium]|nr:hypothetical protein [Gammaproteobacteria bacterium]